jgi:transcriptional regulator GlxA family with amidase domain
LKICAGRNLDLVRRRRAEPFSIDDMVAAVGLEPRTFARRVAQATGVSPIQLLQRLRVERAVKLIETTRLSLEEIARQVGYADAFMLRRIMKRHVGAGVRTLRLP